MKRQIEDDLVGHLAAFLPRVQSFILDFADFKNDIRLIECYLADSIASDAVAFLEFFMETLERVK